MIRRQLLLALTMLALGAAMGIIYLAVLDALVAPAVGLALLAAVLLFACFVATGPLARRRLTPRHLLHQTSWEAQKRMRGAPSIFDDHDPMSSPRPAERREVWRARLQDEARDDAHNRLGL